MVDLKAIRARVEALEPGTWRLDRDLTDGPGFRFGLLHVDSGGRATHLVSLRRADADFAAHARQDVPALLELVDAQAELLTKATELLKKFGLWASDA